MKPVGFIDKVDQGAGDQGQGGLDRVRSLGSIKLDVLLLQYSCGAQLVGLEERRALAKNIHRVLKLLIQI